MSKHLSIATIIDKNKIASDKAFLMLIKVDVKDPTTGAIVQTLRMVRNSENVTHNGNVFQAANFEIDIKMEVNAEPQIILRAEDQTRTLAQYIDLYDGLMTNEVTMIIVNEATMDTPEIEETFIITGSGINDTKVEFNLGVESAVTQRFPNYRQFKNRCAWKYKGQRCKYAGALATCDYSRDGPNGCAAHDNEINFGGFPGINELF